ncbi:MAG TPA: dipeptidase [Methylomusa anaerophila]|uniref:Membrane dipeptidase n=1 Tax=Methylomusa anaerophila TaxID=1930071 RepID=A0A348AI37_9FIRM|nr:dipeptidase [Methylomusa anaerophila]BBB90735.1 Membrane dipeptidase [Methylomusa anaerophila]HML88662.1 dipeptidase [Methylomusa anaerophila]
MIIDLHCDTIRRLNKLQDGAGLRRNNLNVDIEKLQKAGSLAQFFAMFVDIKQDGDSLEYALTLIDRFHQEIAANADAIAFAGNWEDLEYNRQTGKISAFLTIEEGGVVKGNLANLRILYRLGVRLVTLTWNYPNCIGFPHCDAAGQDKGLTSFGIDMVGELNRLGMIIDVSHLSDQGFYDVARLSTQPFTASHSNARAMAGHTRNLTDDMIRTLADKGGIMGINFERSFLGNGPQSKVADMVAHIRHIRNIGGREVIALGSDFDGISQELEIAHMGEIYKLIDGLKASGFTDEDIDKILWQNAARLIRAVMK